MSIIVTPCETKLIEEFNNIGFPILIENLAIGDIHIRKDENTVYIFERKAGGDLDASIKDGRYKEQKGRLIESGLPRKNIVYIIEKLSKANNPAMKKRIWNAICNTQHRDGFSVFQTKSIEETVDYLISMVLSVEKFSTEDKVEIDNIVNVNIKKKQVCQQDWFKYSLTLIPKCSLTIASAITDKFATIANLSLEIDTNGLHCLSDLKHGDSQRRLGKKLSEEICTIIKNNV